MKNILISDIYFNKNQEKNYNSIIKQIIFKEYLLQIIKSFNGYKSRFRNRHHHLSS